MQHIFQQTFQFANQKTLLTNQQSFNITSIAGCRSRFRLVLLVINSYARFTQTCSSFQLVFFCIYRTRCMPEPKFLFLFDCLLATAYYLCYFCSGKKPRHHLCYPLRVGSKLFKNCAEYPWCHLSLFALHYMPSHFSSVFANVCKFVV